MHRLGGRGVAVEIRRREDTGGLEEGDGLTDGAHRSVTKRESYRSWADGTMKGSGPAAGPREKGEGKILLLFF